jgi:hypothetical protein
MSAEVEPAPDEACATESRRAWRLILFGVASVAAAPVVNLAVDGWTSRLVGLSSETGVSAFARLILTGTGLFAAGLAVSLRPNRPAILALACLTCVLARYGFQPAWDSGRLLAGFGAIVAGIATALMAVPQTYRRVGVSLLVLFHFGAILTAVTTPPSWKDEQAWLSQAAAVYLYRPY